MSALQRLSTVFSANDTQLPLASQPLHSPVQAWLQQTLFVGSAALGLQIDVLQVSADVHAAPGGLLGTTHAPIWHTRPLTQWASLVHGFLQAPASHVKKPHEVVLLTAHVPLPLQAIV